MAAFEVEGEEDEPIEKRVERPKPAEPELVPVDVLEEVVVERATWPGPAPVVEEEELLLVAEPLAPPKVEVFFSTVIQFSQINRAMNRHIPESEMWKAPLSFCPMVLSLWL